MDTPVSCRGSPSSANTPTPGLFHGCLRRDSNPRIHSSRKEENPIKTRGRYDLPLISTKAWTGGLSITASRKHGIGLPATLRYAHSDGSGRSVSDMPFGQDGQQPMELGESKVDMKRVQTVCLRFEPSNPLTIMPCTSRNVKSSRVGKAARARRRDGRAAVPSRSCRPVGSCRACATSRSCSRCIGTRIRAGVRRIPLP
jgi:hypothetical protein